MSYHTVYEVSYFSSRELLFGLVVFAGGAVATAATLVVWRQRRIRRGQAVAGVLLGSIWILFSLCWAWTNLRAGWILMSILRSGRCEVTEGTVRVLSQQPRVGHAGGDRVRVGDREFRIDYFSATLSYRQTIAYGGALTDGAKVRLHHSDGEILKVEVADSD